VSWISGCQPEKRDTASFVSDYAGGGGLARRSSVPRRSVDENVIDDHVHLLVDVSLQELFDSTTPRWVANGSRPACVGRIMVDHELSPGNDSTASGRNMLSVEA
jgi:hypothetical protein